MQKNSDSKQVPAAELFEMLERFGNEAEKYSTDEVAQVVRETIAHPEFRALPSVAKWFIKHPTNFEMLKESMEFELRKPQLESYIDALDTRAVDGDLNSLRELVHLAHECSRRVRAWGDRDVALLSLVAETYDTWPINVNYSAKSYEKHVEYLKRLHLGAALASGESAARRTDAPPSTRWAWHLLENCELFFIIAQQKALFGTLPFKHIDTTKAPKMLQPADAPELIDMARNLPGLESKEAIAPWWELANAILRKITNSRPWEIKELSSYANTRRVVEGFDGRKSDAVKYEEIAKAIRQAFEGLLSSRIASHNLTD